jgi:hypothetical protein
MPGRSIKMSRAGRAITAQNYGDCFARVFVHLKDFVHFKFLSTFEYEKQYHEPKLQINNLLSFIFNDKRRRVKKVKIIVCALHAYFAHAH